LTPPKCSTLNYIPIREEKRKNNLIAQNKKINNMLALLGKLTEQGFEIDMSKIDFNWIARNVVGKEKGRQRKRR
jgi:hypothetical protein